MANAHRRIAAPHIDASNAFRAGADELVRFERVSKTYSGGQLVVNDVSFGVRTGEFFTMLGPSGSGKTTSLMMLAGFEEITSGAIYLEGRAVSRLPAHKRNIGVVFQNYALFPHMSVAENLAYPLRVRKIGKAEREQRVSRALQMVRLGEFGERRPKQLSGGQQQRVALARALIFQPHLVLLDEPLGALDKQLREEMQQEIRHIQQELGVTMVYVTHDQSEALTMSDRIAVFRNGRIAQIDAPRTIYEHPVNSFVATFIGENNTLSGVVKSRSGMLGIVSLKCGISIELALPANIAPGQPVIVHIRPEDIRLTTAKSSNAPSCSVVLRELTYTGDLTRAHCELPGGETVSCKIFNRTFLNAPIGRSLFLQFDAENVRVFDAGDEEA
jgi:putative spermidine/putrescine transport system ATP-binding protein